MLQYASLNHTLTISSMNFRIFKPDEAADYISQLVKNTGLPRDQFDHKLPHILRGIGQVISGRMPLRRAWRGLHGFYVAAEDSRSDARLGIKTGGFDLQLLRDKSLFKDMVPYMPTPYRYITPILEDLALCADDVLVDVGSGKGRLALAAAAAFSLRRIDGLEIEQGYVDMARNNLVCAQGLKSPVHFHRADAACWDFLDATAVFLFNPFGERTLGKMLENLESSRRSSPRTLRIAYFNPVHRQLLERAQWLEAAESSNPSTYMLWRSRKV